MKKILLIIGIIFSISTTSVFAVSQTINLSAPYTWTAKQTINYASTTALTTTNAYITNISNLATGFVKVTAGALSVDTATYDSVTTAGDGLTRTANDFDCDTASGSVFGCLSSANWTTFNGKAETTSAMTGTFDGIDFTNGALGANSLWYGGAGTAPSELAIGTGGFLLGVSSGAPAWIATTSIPLAGDVTGTLSATVVGDNSHTHDSTTISGLGTADISGLDISDDTNLAVTYPVVLTGDTVSLAFGTTTSNTWAGLQTFANASTTQVSATKLYAPMSDTIILSATTTMGTGTTTRRFTGYSQDWTLTEIGCSALGGGTFKAQIGDGTASTTLVTSETDNSTAFTTISANNTFDRGEAIFIDFGTVSGTVNTPSCSITRLTR
ncbi:MAG: hypothetical protein WC648_01295 [Candidatus Paceibacterota bacterium]|jgi:hypothetical protein